MLASCRNLARNLRQPVNCRLGVPSKWVPQSSPLSTSVRSQPEQEEKYKSTWSKIRLFMPAVISFGVATWQISCLKRKMMLAKFRESQLNKKPLKSNEIVPSKKNWYVLNSRLVDCKGVYDEKKSILVQRLPFSEKDRPGFNLITPLIPIPGDPESVRSPMLVNRGWVPLSWGLEASKVEQQSSSSSTSTQKSKKVSSRKGHLSSVTPVQFRGVLEAGEGRDIVLPNNPDESRWFSIDVPAIARACGLPETTLYVEEINFTSDNCDPKGPFPFAKPANMAARFKEMPEDHLEYIVGGYISSAFATWGALKKLKYKW